jgi:hypothetical protein
MKPPSATIDDGHPGRATSVRSLRRLAVAFGVAGLIVAALALSVTALRGVGAEPISRRPAWERAAQARLPRSDDPIWRSLTATKVSEDTRLGTLVAKYPPAVKALVGRTVSISGFVLPLESKQGTQHFLLSKYTPVCFFCPPGEPNEVVEVRSTGPIYPDNSEVTVTGRFGLQTGPGDGLLFHLDKAEVSD